MDGSDVSRETFLMTLREDLEFLRIPYDIPFLHRCADSYELLVSWNKTHNLTRITEPARAATRHFAESLIPLTIPDLFPKNASCADLGSGAGFPGIPLALARPDLSWTLIERVKKKAAFLTVATASLALTNTSVVAGDARSLATRFDLVISRAVALGEKELPLLRKLCTPRGYVVVYGENFRGFLPVPVIRFSYLLRGRSVHLCICRPCLFPSR